MKARTLYLQYYRVIPAADFSRTFRNEMTDMSTSASSQEYMAGMKDMYDKIDGCRK